MSLHLYQSGNYTEGGEIDTRVAPEWFHRYRLLSCHDSYMKIAHSAATELKNSGLPFTLLLDSGAFTAWSSGKIVELEHLISVYDSMLTAYEDSATNVWLISLDRIPGSKGKTASPGEINEAVRISDVNFEILQKRYGSRVLPVFHQNESLDRLLEVAKQAEYICISPRNDLPEESRRKWSVETHDLLAKYSPHTKTHGLAATGHAMMTQVPWYSVDSASAVILGINGGIFRDFRMKMIGMSPKKGIAKDKDQHFRTVSETHRNALTEFIHSFGFTVTDLEDNWESRMQFNRAVMNRAAYGLGECTSGSQISLFGL